MKWCALIPILVACGSPPPEHPGADAMVTPPKALTCGSLAFCTTYDVKTFIDTVPAPAGGTLRDGIYRLAYTIDPASTGDTPGYHLDLDLLEIQGTSYNWAGFLRDHIGTVATSDTTVTFQKTSTCSGGRDGEATTDKLDYKYTATAGELDLFSHVMRSDGTQWDRLYAYKRVASPDEACATVTGDPQTPADSAQCRVTNCACHIAINGTVSSCT